MILLSPSRSISGPTLSCFAPSPRCRPNIADRDPRKLSQINVTIKFAAFPGVRLKLQVVP